MSLVTGRPLVKGSVARIHQGAIESVFPFQFNPTELRRGHNADYVFSSSVGSPLPIALFKSIQGPELQFQLMLDSHQDFIFGTGIRAFRSLEGNLPQQAEIESWVSPDIDSFLGEGNSAPLGGFVAPQDMRLIFGPRSWPVVVTSASFQDIMFNRDLFPIRTVVDLSFRVRFVDIATLQEYLTRLNEYRSNAVYGERR